MLTYILDIGQIFIVQHSMTGSHLPVSKQIMANKLKIPWIMSPPCGVWWYILQFRYIFCTKKNMEGKIIFFKQINAYRIGKIPCPPNGPQDKVKS